MTGVVRRGARRLGFVQGAHEVAEGVVEGGVPGGGALVAPEEALGFGEVRVGVGGVDEGLVDDGVGG